MLKKCVMFCTLFSAASFAAPGYVPTFDPSHLKGPDSITPNQVLVLGTPHLRGLPSNFDPKALSLLLDHLAAWQPQIITIEKISGVQCDNMRHYLSRYADTIKAYCWDLAAARKATGLDVPAATAEVDRLMANWPSSPTPAQRRHLAAVFLAAGDQASAYVQWLRLPETEQRAGDGLNQALVKVLLQAAAKHNEDYLIAAPLAARLGLERVYPVDDHTADSAADSQAEQKAFGEVMQRLWDNPASAKRRVQDDALFAHLQTGEDILNLYRAMNSSDQGPLVYESDFGAAMKDTSAQQYGRNYVGYWETRNLRMVANIREILGDQPGKRTLSIVGASHKGYFEAYLNMMHDATLVDVEEILR